ncbi:MAG TPA: molybdopterin-dependent oxidoreductase [Casimicrobiaceae bacterium]|nr:molybdopterin-dependent oxidoreductase [Casimicrobiaceae bacterium]
MTTRRQVLQWGAGAMLASGVIVPRGAAAAGDAPGFLDLPAGAVEQGDLETLAGKVPLIKRSWRPPNYETPVQYFAEDITPNRAFFVRWHLASIPEVSATNWTLNVGGPAAATPFAVNLEQLKRDFPAAEVMAVCQCSGNRRGLFVPHVAGVEWGAGAMGNARWKGARLKDVLAKAGVRPETVEIVLDGADGPVIPATPDFVKSIPLAKAMDENTLIAYEMNGEPLPHWNGFPARIVLPGWTGTYWVKQVTSIQAVAKPYDGFWMKSAYRIPTGRFPLIDRFLTQETPANTPITEMVVNSLISSVAAGQKVTAGQPLDINGVAWDGGAGISRVDVSTDGGRTWMLAELGPDHGRFAFRRFRFVATPQARGPMMVMARASNRAGAAQTFDLIPNPAGYHHNVVQRIAVEVV